MATEIKKYANDVYNARYTLVEDILARLTSRFPKIVWNKNDVVEV